MANHTGKGGKKFKAGQSGNPKGRPSVAPEIRQAKKITHDDFLNDLRKYGTMSRADLDAELLREDVSNFEALAATIVKDAVKGNKDARQVLLERLFGKVKDSLEINNTKDIDDKLDQIHKDEIVRLLRSASEGV
jgi:dsRNA-specific ribonuclease